MPDELKIWALGEGHEVKTVERVTGVRVEDILEETLVRRPEMLESGLRLVGRQTPTDGGPLDLLGVDAGGRLVVFELKREKLTREAVTQCIDYASALDAQTPEVLAELISDHSGTGGIETIEEFDEWYQERFAENELSDLLPPRLALVGLGVDERAEQMARFLAKGGLDISLLTFFGFQHSGETLLARQVEVEREGPARSSGRGGQSAAERRVALEARLAEKGLTELFDDIANTLSGVLPESSQRPGSWGISFGLPSGGGRRRFCHLWVAEAGARVEWLPHSENYDEAKLEALKPRAESDGWRPIKDGYALDIPGSERWEEVREDLRQFLATAVDAWDPAPQSGRGNFREQVWSFLRDVPSGTVVTYGQIARGLGSPEAAQAVGSAMRALPGESDVPWHRVVTAEGRLAASEDQEQQQRLRDEGINVREDGSVDLEQHQWGEQRDEQSRDP